MPPRPSLPRGQTRPRGAAVKPPFTSCRSGLLGSKITLAGGFFGTGQVNRDIRAQWSIMVNYDSAGFRSGSGSQRAIVKWFNSTKGFGFVTLDDGSDAFCHASALSSFSSPDLPQGATVFCDVVQGQRGMQVTTVHSVDLSTAEAQPMSRGPRPLRGGRESGGGPMGDGHVKFFNEQKGFRFRRSRNGRRRCLCSCERAQAVGRTDIDARAESPLLHPPGYEGSRGRPHRARVRISETLSDSIPPRRQRL